MAHKTGSGSTRNNRDSKSKRLGLKCCAFQYVQKGMILVRQRGMTFKAGINVGIGHDYTLYALENGFISFSNLKIINIITK